MASSAVDSHVEIFTSHVEPEPNTASDAVESRTEKSPESFTPTSTLRSLRTLSILPTPEQHGLPNLSGSQWVLILGNSYRDARCLVICGVDH
jgi:hypothetical protein